MSAEPTPEPPTVKFAPESAAAESGGAEYSEYEYVEYEESDVDGDIREAVSEVRNVKATISKAEPKVPRKASLITSIIEFRAYIPDLPTTNQLKKMKVVALEKLLMDCVAQSSGLGLKGDAPAQPAAKTAPTEDAPINLPRPTSGAEALYLANIGIASVIEQITKQTSDYTGVEIDGWSADLKEQKDTLVDLLDAVYQEHSEVCKTYLSPTSVYCMFMLSSGVSHMKPKKKDAPTSALGKN